MRHPKAFWFIVAVFVSLLASWLVASYQYPQTVYDYQQTGQLVEWFDRASGWAVNTVPVWVPDNPSWVDIVRKIAPFSLFILFLAGLYLAVQDRKPKENPC